MTTETLTALQDSIRHWHRLATGTEGYFEAPDVQNCALCGLFTPHDPLVFCRGCPVEEATMLAGCRGTPYIEAHEAWRDWKGSPPSEGNHLAFRRAAAKELNFLLGLLPAEARPAMDAELNALCGTCHVCGLRELLDDLHQAPGGLICPTCA